MKRFTIIKVFFFLIISGQAWSQNSMLIVTGHVFDIATGLPVNNQTVTLNITGNGMINSYEFLSNDEGYWGNDSIIGYNQGTVHASTYDCNGQILEFMENYFPALNTFVFDFYICQDTLPGNDCDNWFQYITNDNWTFQFTGEVFPPGVALYEWDFGDGSFGTGQQVYHIFEPSGVEYYTVCLTTYSTGFFGDTCTAISCQNVYVGEPGGDCINWFWFGPMSGTTFQFHGESSPMPADVYAWNFGDGQTALGQDVIHTFDPGSGEQFLVQLITFSFNPAIGDSCMAFSEQWVYINTTPNCEADFYYEQDTLQSLAVKFYDNSTGNITSRMWDFGNGTTSTETNPLHVYAGPGDYLVCLTITSDSLGAFCTDTFCMEINLQTTLTAGFTFILDTLSGSTRNYFFTENSIGEPESWLWNFGDGNFSDAQNPDHQYNEAGNYNVCLQVAKSFPNGGNLTDDYCHEIFAPSYFDIGGLAFMGDTPLNNPTSTGDTGVAYLYRKYNDAVVPVDTNFFYEFGYYWFSNVREGNHIVKIGLTENSENFISYAPAYYPNHLFWVDAAILQVKDSNNYFADVHLSELAGAMTGPGTIYGYIVEMPNPSMSDYVVDQPVFLYNTNDDLLAYCKSGAFGNFTFENLAYGTYKLVTDVTGFLGEPVIITIDQNNPVYANALLEIYEGSPIGIAENNLFEFRAGQVYPNPVSNQLNLDVVADRNLIVKAIIYNHFGQKIFEKEIIILPGKNTLSISTDMLKNGFYLLSLRTNSDGLPYSFKFLKNK